MRIALPKLSDRQLEKLSDIFSDIALVALASVVLPGFLDKFNVTLVVLGLTAALTFWIISLVLRG